MPLTPAISTDTPQTLDNADWQTAFDASLNGKVAPKGCEIECPSDSAVAVSCRVNEGSPFRIAPGQVKFRHRLSGINKIEFKGDTGTVLWDAQAGQPIG